VLPFCGTERYRSLPARSGVWQAPAGALPQRAGRASDLAEADGARRAPGGGAGAGGGDVRARVVRLHCGGVTEAGGLLQQMAHHADTREHRDTLLRQ
jgi:hypothetical protein